MIKEFCFVSSVLILCTTMALTGCDSRKSVGQSESEAITQVPAAESVQLESGSDDVGKSARIAEQRKQDIQTFFRVQPEQSIVTISDGPGEYADFLAAQVGEKGRVLSLGITEGLANVEDTSVDIVIADTIYRKQLMSKPVREAWLADVHRVLKPDGTFIVAETYAGEDKGRSQVKSPERIDEQFVIGEVSAAGFDLIEQGAPSDPLSIVQKAGGQSGAVPSVQFMVKFRKPPVPPGLQE